MKKIKLKVVTKNNNYPIIIGSGISKNIPKLLNENSINFSKCLLIIDKKIPSIFIKKIIDSFHNKKIISFFFNASEKNKNQKSVNDLLKILLINNFHRNDCIISIGGGITGDVSGFVASIFKRGIKFINVPTTLLAQVDSSIGGKTGINSKYGKNLIGSFYQPSLVVSDINFLKTLPKREIFCGYGEILKHSLISSRKNFTFLDKNASKILNLDSPYIEKSIYQSCLIKKKIIELDEKENNLRKVLNFGHTFAHSYEAALGYSKKLNHGEAVLLGIISATTFSLNNQLLSKKEFLLIKKHFIKYNLIHHLNTIFSKDKLNKLISFMKKDKKNNDNRINLVLLKKIGKPIYNLTFSDKNLKKFIKKQLTN